MIWLSQLCPQRASGGGFMAVLGADNAFVNDYRKFPVDPRITYPTYVSLDRYIDVDRLRSLNDQLEDRIREFIAKNSGDFFVNLYRLDAQTPYAPGVREIWLSRPRSGLDSTYLDEVDKTDIWEPSEDVSRFPELMDFIETLPFQKKGRMLIIYDDEARVVPAHRDHLDPNVCNEFIWFRTNLKKPFYVLDPETNIKKYVESYSAWFDAVNQYHGSDAVEGLSFSIRIDGRFTNEFRNQIPVPSVNPASAPAFWACTSEHAGTAKY